MTARGITPAARIRMVRDELELAARPPGKIITLSRQAVESMLNDLGVAACAARETSEQ